MIEVSVIIPTHNRAVLVARAVQSALAQHYPVRGYEVIVVDNASMDATSQVVQNTQSEFNKHNLRYLREEKLGLHYARHAGARAAEGDILVFTDDDATFDPGWLRAYARAFTEYPDMVAAGGPVRPFWDVPPAKWLLDFVGNAKIFGPLSLMEPYDIFHLDPKGFFFGVNMAIRRSVLFEVGGFNPELIGDLTLGDGESGLVRKLQERGSLIGYVPGALVHHHIPPARMTLDYLSRWQAHLAGAQLYSRYHTHMSGFFRLAGDALWTMLSLTGLWLLAMCVRSRTGRLAVSLQLHAALFCARFRYILRLMYDRDFRRMVTHQDWLNTPTTETKP